MPEPRATPGEWSSRHSSYWKTSSWCLLGAIAAFFGPAQRPPPRRAGAVQSAPSSLSPGLTPGHTGTAGRAMHTRFPARGPARRALRSARAHLPGGHLRAPHRRGLQEPPAGTPVPVAPSARVVIRGGRGVLAGMWALLARGVSAPARGGARRLVDRHRFGRRRGRGLRRLRLRVPPRCRPRCRPPGARGAPPRRG